MRLCFPLPTPYGYKLILQLSFCTLLAFPKSSLKLSIFCFKELTSIYANILGQKKVLTKDEFICHRTGLEHQHGHHLIFMKHQYGCRNVM